MTDRHIDITLELERLSWIAGGDTYSERDRHHAVAALAALARVKRGEIITPAVEALAAISPLDMKRPVYGYACPVKCQPVEHWTFAVSPFDPDNHAPGCEWVKARIATATPLEAVDV